MNTSEPLPTQPPLAVVGLSALFPKAANLDEFWSNIRRGVDAITEVPETHWDPNDYFDENQKTPDMTYARRGGFLSPLPFDPLEFGISPNNLEAIDTSQLLGLVGAKRALEHAGYGAGRQFDRSRVGCILGVTGTLEMVIPLGARLGHPRWRKALKDAGVADNVADDVVNRISESYVPWQENSFPGLLGNVVAGRIANRLDLHGTNCVVDAACASSLSAIHLAALELWTGRSDMIVTGGIDTFNDIFMFMCFSKTPALSPSGDSKPFSDEADGTILGEGVGIVVLKRLADAERDGDRIYAVLKGIGTSSDGAGNAVYAPKAEGQIRCLQDAYRVSGVSPDTIELVEAHGTGTKVGDATEVQGLMQVYQATGRQGPWCAVGSVKSQIGHTKAAAGAAGVIKAILALQHRVLPPTVKVNQPPTPLLASNSPFYVNTESRPWLKPRGYPRRAAVSAFGFGGSNFHCVLEESPQRFDEPEWDGDIQVFALSASTADDLANQLRTAVGALARSDWPNVRAAAARTRAAYQNSQGHRCLCVVERDKTDVAKLVDGAATMLQRYADKASWSTPDGAFYGRGPRSGQLGVLFPGQGSQYVGMQRELACRFPVMQDVLSDANDVFASAPAVNGHIDAPRRLSDYIYPHPAFSAETKTTQDAELRATQVAQPAIGAVSLAVMAVLDQFGIQPEAVAGHSYGELTALCASHRFSPQMLYRLSMLRGQLMAAAQEVDGGMLAVGAPLTQIEAALKELSVDLVVANHNSPTQVVLSGRIPEIDRATSLLASRNIRGKKLSVAAAFHSPLVAPASRAFRPVLDDVDFSPATMPVYANSTAAEYPSDPTAARDLLAAQLARPVHFVQEVEQMYADGVRTFLEVGPGGVLTGLVNSILNGREYRAVAVDSSNGKRGGLFDLATTLAQLAASGHEIRWNCWDPHGADAVPAAASKRMTIPISGANYVKPRAPIPPRASEAMPSTIIDQKANGLVSTSNSPSIPVRPATVLQTSATAPAQPQVAPPGPKIVTPAAAQSMPASSPSPVPSMKNAFPMPSKPIDMAIASSAFIPSATDVADTPPTILEPENSVPAKVSKSVSKVEKLESIRQTLATLQKMQAETSRLHQQFLEGQDAALRTFARLAREHLGESPIEGSFDSPSLAPTSTTLVSSVASSVSPKPVATAPMVTAPAMPASPVVAQHARTQSSYSVAPISRPASNQPTPVMPAPPPVTSAPTPAVHVPAAVRPASLAAPVAPPKVEPTVVAKPVAVPASSTLATAVLSVVSEKTGYPTEMLNLDMSLDHDLGIDSIKRVEILSALQERVSNLPAFQPDELGSLHTLRDVVTLADARAPQSANSPASAPIGAMTAGSAATVQSPVALERLSEVALSQTPSSPLGPVVLAVVSEKTGYPTEMLNLDMSLDHDLGIDSIKRVEILSALQERVPHLPAFQPEELGALHTLRDVVTLADQRSPQTVSRAVAPSALPTTTNPATAQSTAPTVAASIRGLGPIVLKVVSEKTGYPTEMLNLDMSLDHDLGIDSIKRVEILSALQERVLNLPAFQPEELGALHTLRDVVTLADQRTTNASVVPALVPGTGHQPIPSVAPEPIRPVETISSLQTPSAQLGPVVLEVVSEKTGYPTEMLNLDMSLDHDLGIDSIKRVEILSALQERVPELPAFQPEELGALHTLRDVVTLADQRSAGSTNQMPTAVAAGSAPTPPVAVVAPSPVNAPRTTLGPLVLEVVAEKTGYPIEMLNLEMSLDHDLGIDSIKRVEILSALQERVPHLPAFQPEELGALHTLSDVVTLADQRTGAVPPTGSAPPAQQTPVTPQITTTNVIAASPSVSVSPQSMLLSESASDSNLASGVTRSVVKPVPLTPFATRRALQLRPGSEIWITEDGLELSLRIADELKMKGFKPRIVNLDEASHQVVSETLSGLIIVAPQTGMTHRQLWSAVEWLQKSGPALRRNGATSATVLATVSHIDGRFGFESDRPPHDPISGGLAGIAKCAAQEWPEVISRAFDLSQDWSAAHVAAAMFVNELLHEGPVETGITPAGAFHLVTDAERLAGHNDAPVQPGEVIVVSGGARGVTAETAVAMAKAWRPMFVILGRSPEPAPEADWSVRLSTEAEIKRELITRSAPGTTPKAIAAELQQIMSNREVASQLARLRAVGVTVVYQSADVRDPTSVSAMLARIQHEHGPVRGLIHGAGVLADQRIEDKTHEQFERVYETKVIGLKSLLEAIDPRQLKLLGLFSSYTARFGRVGQLDYAIANEVLNKQARQFAQTYPHCRVASFNWGPWDGGMVQGGLKQLFASEGVGLIPLEAGAQLLVREFSQSRSRPVEVLVLADVDSVAQQSAPAVKLIQQVTAGHAVPSQAAGQQAVRQVASSSGLNGAASLVFPAVAPGASNETTSDLKVAYERVLSVADHSFLASHVIGGKAVLPVAIIVEWLAHAAIHRNPGLDLRGLDDLRIFQGVRLNGNERLPLQVQVGRPIRDEGSFKVPLRLVSESNGRQMIHAGGTAILGNDYPAAPAPGSRVALRPYSSDVPTSYATRLFHGAEFQGILAVEGCSGEGIVVASKLAPGAQSWMTSPARGNWLADPLAIDAALQAIILWSQEMLGKPCLPCAVARYRQFRRVFPKDRIRISIRLKPAADQLIRCDVDFLDLQGQLVARMEGCESVADASLSAAFHRNQIEL